METADKKSVKVGVVNEQRITTADKSFTVFNLSLFADKLNTLKVESTATALGARNNVNLTIAQDPTDKSKLILVENTHYTTGESVPNSKINISLDPDIVQNLEQKSGYINLTMNKNENRSNANTTQYNIYQQNQIDKNIPIYCGVGIAQISKNLGIVFVNPKELTTPTKEKVNVTYFNALIDKQKLMEMEPNSRGTIYLAVNAAKNGSNNLVITQSLNKEITNTPMHLLCLNQKSLVPLEPSENGTIKLTYVKLKEGSLMKDGSDLTVYVTPTAGVQQDKNYVGKGRTEESQKLMIQNTIEEKKPDFKIGSIVHFSVSDNAQLNKMMGKTEHKVHGTIIAMDKNKATIESIIGEKKIDVSKLSSSNSVTLNAFNSVFSAQKQNFEKSQDQNREIKQEKGKKQSKENGINI